MCSNSKPTSKISKRYRAIKSFLNPSIVEEYVLENIFKELFIVSSIFQQSQRDFCEKIPVI